MKNFESIVAEYDILSELVELYRNGMEKEVIDLMKSAGPATPLIVELSSILQMHHLMGVVIDTQPRQTEYTERDMSRSIINHFGKLFPNLNFVQVEKVVEKGRVDIFATDRVTHQPVLIELKVSKDNPSGQLIQYAKDFESPRLIAITRHIVPTTNRIHGIEYMVYLDGKLIKA